MNFLNPAALIALVAAGIPIILHLLNLRKLRVMPFSSTALLQELQKSQIRKLQLRQLLLLILRTLLIVFLVLAVARPVAEVSLPGLSAQASSSTLILLDNSFSMEIADPQGERFQQAKDGVAQFLQTASGNDEFALLLMADLSNQRWEEFTRDRSVLYTALPTMKIAYTTAKLFPALQKAAATLATAQNINKNVFIVSDFQQVNFAGLQDSVRLFSEDTHIFLLPIGQSHSIEQNISIDTAIVLTRIFERSKPVNVQVRLRNHSDEPAENVVVSMLFNGQRVIQRAVNIPPNATTTIELSAVPTMRGAIRGVIEVEGDVLDADNRFFFGFTIPEHPRIALIGQPDERRLLHLALQPDTNFQQLQVTPVTPEELPTLDLSQFEVLFLIDIPRITPSLAEQLRQYVLDGGNLAIFPGPRIDTSNYNAVFLPALGLSSVHLRQYGRNHPARFSKLDLHHPLFAGVFRGTTQQQIPESPEIWQAAMVAGEQSIISLSDGPFLSETRLGNGRIFFFAVPPTTEWSNFPLTGIFVTLAFRTAQYLSATEMLGSQFLVGEPIQLILPRKAAAAGSVTLIAPDSSQMKARISQLPEGAVLSLPPFTTPGTWVVTTSDGKLLTLLSCNVPAAESDLQLVAPEELPKQFGTVINSENVHLLQSAQQLRAALQAGALTSELWKLFAVLALICAVAEMLIAKAWRDELPD